jgi:hypothetical protein
VIPVDEIIKNEDDKIIEMIKTKAYMEQRLDEENEISSLQSPEFLEALNTAVRENNKLLIDTAFDKYIKHKIKVPKVISDYMDANAVNGNYFTESFNSLSKQINKTPEEMIRDAITQEKNKITEDNEIIDTEFV